MKVTGSSVEQLEKDKPRSRCRKWRLWASTDCGRKSKRFSGTYTQALDALAEWVSSLEGQVQNSETFGSYARSWVEWNQAYGNYAPGTIANFWRDYRALSRVLGDKPMDGITPEECKAALLDLKHGGAASGAELSNTYMAEMHSTLRMILQTAEDDGKIARNPMCKIKPPKPDTAEKEWLEPMELGLFLNRLDSIQISQWTMALYLIAMLGLRRGEACALLDSDVEIAPDGSTGLAHVHLALKEADGSVDEPKTKAGIRDLPMPARLCRKVEEWRALRSAICDEGAGTLCCNTNGGIMRPQNLARWWRLNRKGLGCEDMGLHQLRHSNLSMMARNMSPFDLKDWAGWSSIAPAKVYVHRNMDSLRTAVNGAWTMLESGLDAPNLHQIEEAGQTHTV